MKEETINLFWLPKQINYYNSMTFHNLSNKLYKSDKTMMSSNKGKKRIIVVIKKLRDCNFIMIGLMNLVK